MSFRWINRQALVLLHDESLAIHGGASGLRDEGLFESALARPENLAAYGAPDVFECAAACAFGLAKNPPSSTGIHAQFFWRRVCSCASMAIV
jgi:death-on-curing protein